MHRRPLSDLIPRLCLHENRRNSYEIPMQFSGFHNGNPICSGIPHVRCEGRATHANDADRRPRNFCLDHHLAARAALEDFHETPVKALPGTDQIVSAHQKNPREAKMARDQTG